MEDLAGILDTGFKIVCECAHGEEGKSVPSSGFGFEVEDVFLTRTSSRSYLLIQ